MESPDTENIICKKCGQQNPAYATQCSKCGNSFYPDIYKGLWRRNLIVTFLLFFVPFIIVFYILHYEVSANFEKQIRHSLNYSVEVNARVIKSFLNERENDLLSINRISTNSIEGIKTKASEYHQLLENEGWFDFLAIADSNGEIVFSTNNIRSNISNRDYFKKAISGISFTSSIFFSELLNNNVLIMAVPLLNSKGKILGVLLASVSLPRFYNLILDLRIGKTSEMFLVDSLGRFLSPSKLGGNVLQQLGYYEKEPNPHIGNGNVIIHRDYRGEKVICAFKKFEKPPWYLVSEMDIEEALAPVNSLRNLILLIFIVFGSFLFFSAIVFSNQVTNLLKKLTIDLKGALDDICNKKVIIDEINAELRKRLKECENLSKRVSASEKYIKGIIDSITSAMFAIDKDYHITYCNNFARNFFKIKNTEDFQTIFQVSTLFEDAEVKSRIESIFLKNLSFNIEKKSVLVEGNQIILSISGFPLETSGGTNSATLLISDITTNEQMRAQMADYEKLSALSQLALGAAHEINNPLLGITSYIELLIEEESNVDKKTRAKEVLESAYRISETVRGLLNFARPTPPKFTKVNLNGLISETISFLKHQPLFKKIKIEKNLAETIPEITADSNQIRQVLVNVMLNAAQSIQDKGTITACTNKIKFEDYVEIKIIDTGIGISPENLKRVFEPFFTTKKGKGTGLGLSISLSYVKNHNGNITISSEVGKGTEVRIMLPTRQEGRVSTEVIDD
jgi:signal transduction histidine kinase